MTPAELKTRLDLANRKRDDLSLKIQRVIGRLEESERAREALRQECLTKNIDPDKIEETIAKLTKALETDLLQFESSLEEASKAMEPFTSRK